MLHYTFDMLSIILSPDTEATKIPGITFSKYLWSEINPPGFLNLFFIDVTLYN